MPGGYDKKEAYGHTLPLSRHRGKVGEIRIRGIFAGAAEEFGKKGGLV